MTGPPIERHLPRGQAVLPAIVQVHFDGASQPPDRRGFAGYGFTVDGDGLTYEESGPAAEPFSESATNNVAEYVAASRALEWLRSKGFRGTVLLFGDSELVIRQMNGEYEVRSDRLKPYHQHLEQLSTGFESVRFAWIPREENLRADALSKEAIDRLRSSRRRTERDGGLRSRDGPRGGAD